MGGWVSGAAGRVGKRKSEVGLAAHLFVAPVLLKVQVKHALEAGRVGHVLNLRLEEKGGEGGGGRRKGGVEIGVEI